MYRLLRPRDSKNPHPVIVSSGFKGRSSYQYKAHLLCEKCELRFSVNGEEWILKNCCRDIDGRFPLREALYQTAPLETDEGGGATFSTAMAHVDWEKLAYFAISVFWRASVHDWPLGNQRVRRIDISPAYKEQLRQYLLGEAAFPKQAVLWAWVSALSKPLLAVKFPTDIKRNVLFVNLAGMRFDLLLGHRIEAEFFRGCLVHAPQHPIFVSSVIDKVMATQMMQKVKAEGKTLREIAGLQS